MRRLTARRMSRTRRKPGLPERSEGVGSSRLLAFGSRTLRVRANGFELSGPAKSCSDYRAELAGSAPASG